MASPESMRSIDSLSTEEVIQFIVGLHADYFRVEGDYAAFIQTHLMSPLTGAHRGEETSAPAARERPRVTPASRARGRGASRARQRTDWPELPTALTCCGSCSTCTGSTSSNGRKEKRQAPAHGQGRARDIRAESGPSKSILSDDDAKASDSEEAASQHLESSKGGDGEAGSGSESGGDNAEEGYGAESGDDACSGSGSDSDSGANGDSAPIFVF
ncbi:uncharacterized protein LOC114288794 [Camellia sinensis]|uniref:uncharacterized protein LOC114288794 n=1 Tax=Camellia sinensis TaxID=4442 RepID=UPI0010362A05|nr:uncharacterized protein LOC114288794 [Camellia sinensis]